MHSFFSTTIFPLLLIKDPADTLANAKRLSAVRHQFLGEQHAAVQACFSDRSPNLFVASHPDPFPWLEVELASGSPGSFGQLPDSEWIRSSAANPLHRVVNPAHWRAESDARRSEPMKQERTRTTRATGLDERFRMRSLPGTDVHPTTAAAGWHGPVESTGKHTWAHPDPLDPRSRQPRPTHLLRHIRFAGRLGHCQGRCWFHLPISGLRPSAAIHLSRR